MIVADNETDIDYLYYEPVAKTVVRLIREKAGEPLTIGLHGDWGAGKSSSLLMIERSFAAEDSTLCVRFNGWLFEGYDDAKAVLIETIIAELLKKRSTIPTLKAKAAHVLKNVSWMKVARTLGGAAMTAFTGLPSGELVQGLGKVAKNVIANPADVLTGEMFTRVFDGTVEHFKTDGPENNAPQRIHQFRQDFEELLAEAKIDRLVVLVDDLDRCLPETAIATLEAIRLFLFVPNAAFVIAADEGMIEYAVRRHFPELPSTVGPNSYARNYLEKLIQVPFRMPALGQFETRIYLTLLLYLNAGADAKSDAFKAVIDVAREALRKPWIGEGFSRDEIGKKTAVNAKLDEALQVAADLTPILAEGASGNPRQIKRFANSMKLRLEIAEERGFGKDLSAPILGKLMLAERFSANLFNTIASDSATSGKSKAIADLEGAGAPGAKPTTKADPRAGRTTETSAEEIWATHWAALSPKLADVDLRPYIFVSRDRRANVGPSLVSDPVAALSERLSSTAMTVRTTDVKLVSSLTTGDAERVFEALGLKVTSAGDLRQRPDAAEGLAFLVETRRELQDTLLVLLSRMPVGNLGSWVLTGWQKAFDTGHQAKFREQVKSWAAQDENTQLRDIAKLQLSAGQSRKRGAK
jgi:predicted KAP-like P-loop ATPase